MTSEPTRAPERAAPDSSSERSGAAAVDIRLLAEKVYRLMLADLRLEQARGARPPRGGGRP